MANTNSKTKKTAAAVDQDVTAEAVQEKVTQKKIVPKKVDQNHIVKVISGFPGRLVYKDPRTGEKYIWPMFGSVQEMEIRTLRTARYSYKIYFVNNWFMFDEEWVPEYLGVSNCYKNAIGVNGFDEIFDLKGDELRERIGQLSDGQKQSVAFRARTLIAENKIDSLSAISILEETLGIELIEK